MPLTMEEMLEGPRASRRFFLKHLRGLREDQWDWKPYPECKSITETLAHLVVDDRAALQSLQSGQEPDYEALTVDERDRATLLDMLAKSHEQVISFITSQYAGADLGTPVCVWGVTMPLGRALGYLTAEDHYHAGQVSFIRLATDPAWDYYSTIYGGE
jgi:uncharacterized damage-inducible protein DinB